MSTTDIVGRMLTCTRTNALVSKESQQMVSLKQQQGAWTATQMRSTEQQILYC